MRTLPPLKFRSLPNHQKAARARLAALEWLEARHLLSNVPMGPYAEVAELHSRDVQGHGDRDLHSQTHLIDGVSHVVAWEPAPADLPPSAGGSLTSSTHPLTSIPQLHSNPGAKATLYLDFDGHFESLWGAWSNITTPVYDIDGDESTFNDRELSNMRVAWERASEDFAPFNVDVTTVEPSVLAPGVPIASANKVALRIAIGGDSEWLGANWGGYSYINSFTSVIANVAYVFAGGHDSPLWMGDTVSHEAGHGFGLQHQSTYDANGVKLLEYNTGTSAWAPLMGSQLLFSTPVTTWHNGTSSLGATIYQDDMAVIAGTTNAFGYRTDDRGNTQATATPLAIAGNTWVGSGLISTNSDVDVYSFRVNSEDTYKVSASVASPAPNLDAVVELRNSAGLLLGSAAPSSSLGASLVKNLTPGDYFVTVKSSSVHGWVGSYSVKVDAPLRGVTVTPGSRLLNTTEAGGTASITVSLDTRPLANVVIPVSSTNPAEGSISTSSLVFTPTNWEVPQTITVTGVADGVSDSDASYAIVLAAAVSGDAEYGGFDPADTQVVNVDVDSPGFIYRIDFATDIIERSRLHGAQPDTLVDLKAVFGTQTGYTPNSIAVDAAAGQIYWTDSTTHAVHRANLDGSGVATIVPATVGATSGIALDLASGKIYWVDSMNASIRRANLDGTAIEVLVTSTASGMRGISLDPDGGKMYWADLLQRQVYRANLDGSGVEIIWQGQSPSQPTGIAVDAASGKVYWADNGLDTIQRANLDGSGLEVLVQAATFTDLTNVNAISLDLVAGKLYWTDASDKGTYRANLDGSSVVLLAKSGSPSGLAIARPAPAITVTHRTGLVTTEARGTDVFRVSLATRPTSNVTIPIASTDTTEGTLSATSLTFTPANWDVIQVVTLTGVDDSPIDGDVAYSIILGAATSADPSYQGIDPADVSVTNLDNDKPVTKFYVVNDGSPDRTFEYTAEGASVENYAMNVGNTAPRGAASTAAGTTVWVVDANRKVYIYDAGGSLLGSWTAGTLASNATVEGIATNGTDIWIVDAKSDKVFRYANAASLRSGTQVAASSFTLNIANAAPKDIVTDGVNLWVVNDSTADKVFKYSLTGSLLGSWTMTGAGGSPTGITLDPAGGTNLWVVDSSTDRVYQFNNARGLISGSLSASASFALASGNTNPQGIADPPARESLSRSPLNARPPKSLPASPASRASGRLEFFALPNQEPTTLVSSLIPTGPRELKSRLTSPRRLL